MKFKQTQVIFALIFVFIFGLSFILIGKVESEIGGSEIKLSGTLVKSTTVKFNDIQSIEYIDSLELGRRNLGLGTLKMSLGSYNNEEYGNYRIYAYKSIKQFIVIKYNDKILVFNQSTIENTMSIYNTLKSKLDKIQ